MQRCFLLILPCLLVCFLTQCGVLSHSAYHQFDHQKKSKLVETAEFKAELAKVGKAEWHQSDVKTLINGDSFFPVMRDAVSKAEKSITFETFAMVSGTETFYFCHALAERARQGVKVNVILDGVGSKNLGKVCTDILVDSGVNLQVYRKFSVLRPLHGNRRDHRKLLIVDGKVGFTGGAGYANAWMGNARNSEEWRDTMYQVSGPAVADMQHAFADNWKELTGETLAGTDFYPTLQNKGNDAVQVTLGAPEQREDTIGASYLLAIDAAQESIFIEHAYFVPNRKLRTALKNASARGVSVKVIVPGDMIDSKIVGEASKLYWRDLISGGVEIYQYQETMMHSKLIVVDDYLTIAGSGNFDNRSLFVNDEANIHILSKDVAMEQRTMLENDLKRCIKMTPKNARVKLSKVPLRVTSFVIMPQL